jgi:hypothetical protein
MNNETLKILSEDSRVTKLNSDIINLIWTKFEILL